MKWLLTTKDGKQGDRLGRGDEGNCKGEPVCADGAFWDQETLSSWPLSPDCSTQMFPRIQWFGFKAFFFFFFHLNTQQKKINNYFISLFLCINIQHIKIKISIPPKVNFVHLMSILLNFWMDGCTRDISCFFLNKNGVLIHRYITLLFVWVFERRELNQIIIS